MEFKPTEISISKMFGGYNKRYKHYSPTLGCSMNFHIFFPPSSSPSLKFPVLYWLSGLTCTDENFIAKSGAQRAASSEGVALIVPDTSPRGLNVEGESDSWDFGVGAGFYLNATQEKWKNWKMYDYVVKELPTLLHENFPELDTSRASIFGHSMGGHGALTIYLKNLDKYKSVSAFAPIANPVNCPWGLKAFTNYLGENKADWEEYDVKCPRCRSSVFPNLDLSALSNIRTDSEGSTANVVTAAQYVRSQPSSQSYLLRMQGLLRPVRTQDAGLGSEVDPADSSNQASTPHSHGFVEPVQVIVEQSPREL